jgi:putative flippase GtrA
VNIGGMIVAVGCLAVSHYVLGLRSPLADNIAANGVGLVLGTAFRYVCYRYIVFTEDAPQRDDAPDGEGAAIITGSR